MATKCFDWDRICYLVFKLIPKPLTDRRLLVALDDKIRESSGIKKLAWIDIIKKNQIIKTILLKMYCFLMQNTPVSSNKNLITGCFSAIIEWYDFGLYLYMIPVFSGIFFHHTQATVSVIYGLLLFALSYICRPIGGIILGWVGEKTNRKTVLMITTFMMFIALLIIASLPTSKNFATLSIYLLTLARAIQGLSVGGEYVSLYVFLNEAAKPRCLGKTVSLGNVACGFGMLLAVTFVYAMYSIFSIQQIHTWAFRLPFIFGIILSIITLIAQKGLVENPRYKKDKITYFPTFSDIKLCSFLFLICGFATSIFYFTVAFIPSITAVHIRFCEPKKLQDVKLS